MLRRHFCIVGSNVTCKYFSISLENRSKHGVLLPYPCEQSSSDCQSLIDRFATFGGVFWLGSAAVGCSKKTAESWYHPFRPFSCCRDFWLSTEFWRLFVMLDCAKKLIWMGRRNEWNGTRQNVVDAVMVGRPKSVSIGVNYNRKKITKLFIIFRSEIFITFF